MFLKCLNKHIIAFDIKLGRNLIDFALILFASHFKTQFYVKEVRLFTTFSRFC